MYDIETFFNPNDPELDYYKEYRDRFENDNTLILLAIESDGSIFTPAFLQKIDAAADSLLALPQVEYVSTPTQMHRYMFSPLGIPFRLDLLNFDDAEVLKIDSARIYQEGTFLNSILPSDAGSLSLLVKARSHISDDVHKGLLSGIDKTLKANGLPDYHLGGRIIVENYYV
jgi:uncharacterized protein